MQRFEKYVKEKPAEIELADKPRPLRDWIQ